MEETIYKFVGKGLGVPGLPHVLTESEAQRRGVLELLEAALANGNYEAIKPKKKETKVKKESE
jgi:hypothetical protein